MEAENVIAAAPAKKKTIREHSEFLVQHKIKPSFALANTIVVMFDDPDPPLRIKNTDDLRYTKETEALLLDYDFEIDDWDQIFKNKKNKQQFKRLFTMSALQFCGQFLKEGQRVLFNGCFENGGTKEIFKNELDYVQHQQKEDLSLSIGESDIKIFEIMNKLQSKNVLIVSLDTDVKLLALFFPKFCQQHTNKKCIFQALIAFNFTLYEE